LDVILYELLTGTTRIERGESAAAQMFFAARGRIVLHGGAEPFAEPLLRYLHDSSTERAGS